MKDVLACSFAQRMRQLKQQHADLNLLTVREFAALSGRSTNWCYQVIKSLELTKFRLDDVTYLVSGVEFWEKAQDHPHYAQLFLKK